VNPPVAMSIAGSDSGGAAGIQADMRTFAALGVFGTTAITCVTAQNTTEVRAAHALPAPFVRQQIEAVLEDMNVGAAKTGLLSTEEIVKEVAALAPRLPALVVDPVLVASTGQRLTESGTVHAYRQHLFPVATVVTPNLIEAGVLLDRSVATVSEAREAARRLGDLAPIVVVKGGHLSDLDVSVDVIWDGSSTREIIRSRVETVNTHGSGCTFSAAIAAFLARGLPVTNAIERANEFAHTAIRDGAAWRLGRGHGPLNHFGWSTE
jgi:hydroxymethylpyrimidine/phosphomethylpyrimidine kinase